MPVIGSAAGARLGAARRRVVVARGVDVPDEEARREGVRRVVAALRRAVLALPRAVLAARRVLVAARFVVLVARFRVDDARARVPRAT